MSTQNCPVCNAEVSMEVKECPQCKWPISVKPQNTKHYQAELEAAQTAWQVLQPKTYFQEKYLFETAPNFEQDSFETFEDFRKRLSGKEEQFYLAGYAVFKKINYNIDVHQFEMIITWQDWVKNLSNLPTFNREKLLRLVESGLFINISRDQAKQLYEADEQCPVYIKLSIPAQKSIGISDIQLISFSLQESFSVLQLQDEKEKQEALNTNDFDGYLMKKSILNRYYDYFCQQKQKIEEERIEKKIEEERQVEEKIREEAERERQKVNQMALGFFFSGLLVIAMGLSFYKVAFYIFYLPSLAITIYFLWHQEGIKYKATLVVLSISLLFGIFDIHARSLVITFIAVIMLFVISNRALKRLN